MTVGIEQNVALVTFGHITTVVQHMTNDYRLLKEQIGEHSMLKEIGYYLIQNLYRRHCLSLPRRTHRYKIRSIGRSIHTYSLAHITTNYWS